MTYELAKQLKDAGFPQVEVWESRCPCHEPWGMCGLGAHDQPPSYMPSLSELIEACGDRFGSLNRNFHTFKYITKYWTAVVIFQTSTNYLEAQGDTPEEAVAKLWLALKKH